MANQQYIFALENRIIEARQAVNDAREAYEYECQNGTGRGHAHNHDVWGTLHTNVLLLESCVKALLELTKKEFPS